MKTTHLLYQWHRYSGERKFTRGATPYRAFVKKNGIVKYYPHYPLNYPSFFQNRQDARTIRVMRIEDYGTIRKCEVYYTLRKV